MNRLVRGDLSGTGVNPDEVALRQGAAARGTEPKVVSLFAGIGGFDRAFEAASAEVVAQCEIDKYCRSVLRRHWPKAALFEDIGNLSPSDVPDADIWTAGFPCQDVSLARGNHGRSGLKGNHTSLFFKLVDLIEVKRPKVILLENVVGLLNSHKGCDFAIIVRELTSRGYAVSWRVLNARYFGAPQSRSRVFLCAWLGDPRLATAALFEEVEGARYQKERDGFMTLSRHRSGAIVPQVAYCVAATSGRHTGNDWSRSYISYDERVRRPTATESERLQGFPAGWTVPEPEFRVSPRGLDSERYKAVGNAVAVPVVAWIAKRIVALLSEQPSSAPARPTDIVQSAPDLRRRTNVIDVSHILEEVDDRTFAHRWMSGGCAWDMQVVEGAASAAPSRIVPSRFVDVLDDEVPDDRYFLTANAAAGIIRRADIVGRTLFPPMRSALENMVSHLRGESPLPTRKAQAGDGIAESSVRATGAI